MFKHILVAIDQSPLRQAVLQQAIALAKDTRTALTILNILSPEDSVSPVMPLIPVSEYYPTLSGAALDLYQEAWRTYEQHGLEYLKDCQRQAAEAGVSASIHQRRGTPGRAICDAARDLGVDLILIGRRGHSGLSELLVGSVSNYVMHHAPCSVLVVNPVVASVETDAVTMAQTDDR